MAWSDAARAAAAEANNLSLMKGFARGAQARADASGWGGGKERKRLLKLAMAEQRANNLRLLGK